GRSADVVRLLVLSVVSYAIFAYGEAAHIAWLQPLNVTEPPTRTIAFASFMVATSMLLSYLALIWSSSTANFVVQREAQTQELFQTNQQLMEKSIQQVELGSDLAQSAAELLTSSHEPASGATEQASAVSQVSTTIEELGSTARQIAVAAEQ